MALIPRAPRHGVLLCFLLCPVFLCGQVYVAFIVGEQGKARTVLESPSVSQYPVCDGSVLGFHRLRLATCLFFLFTQCSWLAALVRELAGRHTFYPVTGRS